MQKLNGFPPIAYKVKSIFVELGFASAAGATPPRRKIFSGELRSSPELGPATPPRLSAKPLELQTQGGLGRNGLDKSAAGDALLVSPRREESAAQSPAIPATPSPNFYPAPYPSCLLQPPGEADADQKGAFDESAWTHAFPDGVVPFPDDAWIPPFVTGEETAALNELSFDNLPPSACEMDFFNVDMSMSCLPYDESGWDPIEHYESGYDLGFQNDVTSWEECGPDAHDLAVQRLLDALMDGKCEKKRKLKNFRMAEPDFDASTSVHSDAVSTVSQSASSWEPAPLPSDPDAEATSSARGSEAKTDGGAATPCLSWTRDEEEDRASSHSSDGVEIRRFGASRGEVSRRPQREVARVRPSAASYGTTVMVRNIPNKYTREMLVAQLSSDFLGEFDFIYLPIDFRNCCNVGYGFVNFRTPESCRRFVESFDGVEVQKCLPGLNSRKVVEVTPARVHGLDANVRRLRSSPVMNTLVDHPEWMPLIFDEEGRELPFPIPDQLVPEPASRRRGGDRLSGNFREAASAPQAPQRDQDVAGGADKQRPQRERKGADEAVARAGRRRKGAHRSH
eukprot:TRINITY_DN27998_c0_g1_i1.p1 TRINITY_DN27998_c0_g1~~TRINITY_DN27998_c0_g1_i1.p1  ORF type:complete len:566 (+),score=129.21 TRINITY_DN27998_c0_g1_i1:76-1773(+)